MKHISEVLLNVLPEPLLKFRPDLQSAAQFILRSHAADSAGNHAEAERLRDRADAIYQRIDEELTK
jgi:hypothetical protein